MHRTYGCSANPHRSRPLCDFCGRKFCQPQKLKVHIKRMHSDFSEVLKEFQCKSCLKILGSRAALQRHAKEVHQKQTEGQCSCSRCGKRFQNKSNLKIHMLTHSGIKPFRCSVINCSAAFTTKQCLQFHYKKVHNFTEENMPKIKRSVDYTFQAYSGSSERGETSKCNIQDLQDKDSDFENESLDSQNLDDPPSQQDSDIQTTLQNPSPPLIEETKISSSTANIKVLSKGSKKWIADEPPSSTKLSEIYSVERLSKDDFSGISLQDAEIYDRNKISNINDFSRHDASNASLLVEAALDSVCNEPNLDIDVSTTPNCSDTLVNNLYTLTQPDNIPDVSYTEPPCINDSRDINLMSPSVNDHVSVTDDLNDELRDNDNIGINYSNFNQNFSPPHSPDVHRSNFVRNYINSLSPHNTVYEQKNLSPVPSPPRFDFGHGVSTDRLSSDDSNGMAVQNLSIHNSKNDIQLDLSIYKTSYKVSNQDFRKIKFENVNNPLDQDHIDVIHQNELSNNIQSLETEKGLNENPDHVKYSDDLPSDIRNKFDIDLDIRLKNYDNSDSDALRQRNHTYENSDFDFRSKTYELIEAVENRNKQYDIIESDFRTDRNFEPLVLNSSELQGLDMSARNFHNYSNINRYHHLYSDVDRVDLRLNYSPPPPYTHADILRVVSLDLTSPGRHSVDLSLRNHPLHQIANSRLLSEHGLQANPHRLLDQSRLISADLSSGRHLSTDRIISETGSRILTDHTTSRILTSDPISTNHLLNSDQGRIISEDTRIMSDQTRLLESRILPPATPSGSVSPVQAFTGYSVSQNPYHPTPLPRSHVTSPTPTPYHYPTYY